jgi:hypothetical protein
VNFPIGAMAVQMNVNVQEEELQTVTLCVGAYVKMVGMATRAIPISMNVIYLLTLVKTLKKNVLMNLGLTAADAKRDIQKTTANVKVNLFCFFLTI